DDTDPAAELAAWLDRVTLNQAVRRSGNRRRVAGLIPTPAEPVSEDMRAALAERQELVESAAGGLLHYAISEGESWIKRLGAPGDDARSRTVWIGHATTVALYGTATASLIRSPWERPRGSRRPSKLSSTGMPPLRSAEPRRRKHPPPYDHPTALPGKT
ncbi:hypothetical protein HMPREF0183_1027, partial [Brevibacterium mcbrellneri ATCC 49030]